MRVLMVGVGLMALVAAPLPSQTCPQGKVALVLSGGGVKGIAHIGVIEALDRLGTKPDLIVGTSMGAIVGALYASGLSAQAIDSLLHDLPVSEVVRPFRRPSPHPWENRIPLVFVVRGRHGFTLQTGIVDEAEPNARLNAAMLRGNLLGKGRFDSLPIPFRAVATDLRNRQTVVLDTGDLAKAVRASSAIPLVFPPVQHGEAVLVDGGLSANIPILEARAAGATRIIVSDVTEHPRDSLDVESPLALADQLLGFLFHQPPAPLADGDVLIRPSVQEFRSLDFSPRSVAEIRKRGREAADSAMAGARCLEPRPSNEPRLPRILAQWRVAGDSRQDSILVNRHLGLQHSDRLDLARLHDGLLALADAEALRGVWLNPAGSGDSVTFRIEPLGAPRSVGGLGLAYDHELGGRLWAGLFDRRAFGATGEGSLLISLSRLEREVVLSGLAHLDAGSSRLTPVGVLHLRDEDVRQFDRDGAELPSLDTRDARLTAGIELRPNRQLYLRLAAEALGWQEARAGSDALGASGRVGWRPKQGPAVAGELLWAGPLALARLETEWATNRGPLRLTTTTRVRWGRGLPNQWTEPLGGDRGFPGLHLGERRAPFEAHLSARLGVALLGPVEARASLDFGRAWGGLVLRHGTLAGLRAGFGADTPLGPIDAAFGAASNGRTALYLRLGQWF